MLVHAIPTNATYDFADDVRAGLTRSGQKELPSKYLYDDVGSASVRSDQLSARSTGLRAPMSGCSVGMPARLWTG